MSLHLGDVPAGITLYIPFATYDGATGASETCSGLAVTDIEIYKNGSVTQRSSDAGYTLLDTDGIDFDALTGINGFSVDLNDNTDAGFFSVGGFYWVVVSSITADAQTVNFIAATFRIVAAEATAGYPQVDTARISNDATAADNAEAFFDGTGYAGTGNVIPTVTTLTGHTAQTGDAYARLGAPAGASVSADVAAVKAETASILTDTAEIGAAGAGLTNINLPNQTMDIVGNITGNLSGSVGSVTGAVGSVTGNVGGNVTGSVASVAAGGIAAASFGAAAIDAASLATDAVEEIRDALLSRALATYTTGATVGDALRRMDSGANGLVPFTCAASSTTTAVITTLTEATDDHYNGRTIVFLTGALAGQAATISDYVGATKTFTVAALTEAPAENDTGVIV